MGRKVLVESDAALLESLWDTAEHKVETPEQLAAFIKDLLGYSFDYGAVVHAVAMAAIAAARTISHSNSGGGITGFQAGIAMWMFVRRWKHVKDAPMCLIEFDDALYPQSRDSFVVTLPQSVMDRLQKRAQEELQKHPGMKTGPVYQHWKKLAAGTPPFGLKITKD